MALKDWKKTSDSLNYKVWGKKEKQGGWRNNLSVVVKKEEGKWITFFSLGTFESSKTLNRGGTKLKNIKIAKKYMRLH